MNNAKLYSETNKPQMGDAAAVLSEFKEELKKYTFPGAQILDIGSGDGSVTIEVLQKSIPNNNVRIFGVDISTDMTDFATKKYSATTGVEFFVMDISKAVEYKWTESFDLIVSFFCLHWVQDQRMAFINIHTMLKEGGGALIINLLESPLPNIFGILVKNPSWSEIMKNIYKDYIPYLLQFDKPEDECRKVIENSKLTIKHLEVRKKKFSFNGLQKFKDFFMSVNPYIGGMPPEKVTEFMNDGVEAAFTLPSVQVDRDESGEILKITLHYELLVAYIVK